MSPREPVGLRQEMPSFSQAAYAVALVTSNGWISHVSRLSDADLDRMASERVALVCYCWHPGDICFEDLRRLKTSMITRLPQESLTFDR